MQIFCSSLSVLNIFNDKDPQIGWKNYVEK